MKYFVVFLLMASYAFAVNPVARWPLDDQTGTKTIRDVIGTNDGKWIGTELVTNGDFASDITGWNLAGAEAAAPSWENIIGNPAGSLKITHVENNTLLEGSQQTILTIGNTYSYSVDVFVPSSDTPVMYIGSDFGATRQTITPSAFDEWQTKTGTILADNARLFVATVAPTGDIGYFDNVSVREIAFSNGTGIEFDGVGDYVDIGTGPSSVKTVSLWIKLDDVSGDEFVMDLNNSDYLTVGSGVVTIVGFTAPTLYVNGVEGTNGVTTIPALTWSHIVITDTTASNANDLDIGRVTTFYYDGLISDVRLYNVVLTPNQVKGLFKGEGRKLRARYNNKEYEPSLRARYN